MSTGRSITNEELKTLEALGAVPEKLISVLKTNVISKNFELTEEEDASGFGVEMAWMDPKTILEEALEYFPGQAALKENYIPVGTCLKGSGDPYFVKEEGGVLNVYRIPHDAITDNDELDSTQVEFVCELASLLKKG